MCVFLYRYKFDLHCLLDWRLRGPLAVGSHYSGSGHLFLLALTQVYYHQSLHPAFVEKPQLPGGDLGVGARLVHAQ